MNPVQKFVDILRKNKNPLATFVGFAAFYLYSQGIGLDVIEKHIDLFMGHTLYEYCTMLYNYSLGLLVALLGLSAGKGGEKSP